MKGIFYPQMITGDSIASKKSQDEIRKMTDYERVFYNMTQNDTLVITGFEELKFLSTSPTIKRFRFWNHRKGFANPQVWFIELTNSAAKNNTELQSFIDAASVTFLKSAWIII